MANETPPSLQAPRGSESPPRFALPGMLVVFVTFMTQFMTVIMGGGMLFPYYHEQGVHWAVIAAGALAAFAVLQIVLGFCLKHVPVRCLKCRSSSRFLGFGWWPFIYRFACYGCGIVRRFEVGGR